eukprot:TRINITY_DN41443_c0_g1_i2.p2 TRINITY_DN41443_c0_g1~~TRINITY_DN41443_c0_g1_i2.p2  ORF type:complete len:262 (+),score=-12.38 TRINITY_DN41443_c0_g1_i2:152-937(+)
MMEMDMEYISSASGIRPMVLKVWKQYMKFGNIQQSMKNADSTMQVCMLRSMSLVTSAMRIGTTLTDMANSTQNTPTTIALMSGTKHEIMIIMDRKGSRISSKQNCFTISPSGQSCPVEKQCPRYTASWVVMQMVEHSASNPIYLPIRQSARVIGLDSISMIIRDSISRGISVAPAKSASSKVKIIAEKELARIGQPSRLDISCPTSPLASKDLSRAPPVVSVSMNPASTARMNMIMKADSLAFLSVNSAIPHMTYLFSCLL